LRGVTGRTGAGGAEWPLPSPGRVGTGFLIRARSWSVDAW